METYTILIISNALFAIVLQVLIPRRRHTILLVCASIALVLINQTVDLTSFLGTLPFDVVLLLFGLTVFGEFIFDSNIFDWLLKQIAILCKGKLHLIIIMFNIIIFLVSSILNNYQALLLMIPPWISLLKLINGLNQRYLVILFSSVLIISNLAGCSTPIGDFPALFLLSKGEISFASYFANTTPFAVLAAIVIIISATTFYNLKPIDISPESEKLSVAYTVKIYRNIQIHWVLLIPSTVVFSLMFICWLKGFNPTIVSLIGLSILALIVGLGKYSERKITNVDASVFIYFISLFIIIASIQQTGILERIGEFLQLIRNPLALILVFSLTVMLITGFVSAGPSTVAFFPIVKVIQDSFPENMAITCFCLSICAGSSLFLTAATAGPLLTRLTEKEKLTIEKEEFIFSFKYYLMPGVIGAIVIFFSNILYIFFKI